MSGYVENGSYRVSVVDLEKRLEPIQGICVNDPRAIWEEDGAKIELLTEVLEYLKQNHSSEVEAIKRIMELLEVLRWKRSDLGRLVSAIETSSLGSVPVLTLPQKSRSLGLLAA